VRLPLTTACTLLAALLCACPYPTATPCEPGGDACPAGTYCSEEFAACVELPEGGLPPGADATSDAGLVQVDAAGDAAAGDGASSDTSRSDLAQPDVGLVDGALPDASLPDAARPDAARPDGAQLDAPPPDSLLPDTLLPDTLLPDTLLPDTLLPDTLLPDTLLLDTLLPDTLLPDTSLPDTVPPPSSCADGSVEQTFGDRMVGCAGTSNFGDRADLCGAGWYVCSAAEWVNRRAGQAPTHSYWTDDNLRYAGSDQDCQVLHSGGSSCSSSSTPMRVCADYWDPELNQCNWINCGYLTNSPNEYFGGCNSSYTAGTLCCR